MWKCDCGFLDSYKARTNIWEAYPLEATRTWASNEFLYSVLPHPCGHPVTSLLFSHSVASDSSQPHGLQHARPPCPPLFPRLY